MSSPSGRKILSYNEKTSTLNYVKMTEKSKQTNVKSYPSCLYTKWHKKVAVLVISILLVLLVFLYYANLEDINMKETEEIQTDGGVVIGVIESFKGNGKEVESYTFKGIPYALPPVGKLRFRPPKPLSQSNGNSWKGIYKAHQYGSQCVQRSPNKTVVGSEDCLFLNVYSPSLDKNANLPVFVWIHGGYLIEGNGNMPGYTPNAEFVTSMNVVAVSMNYRLNAFGFLTLKELWEEGESYGNYGIMDQILVLKWIKTNIHRFGGNPNQVTICGQSSGGTSIFALLVSPMADGLFNNVIPMSGSPRFNKTYVEASEDNKVLLNQTRCANEPSSQIKECLLNLKASAIINAIPYNIYPNWGMIDLTDFPTKGLLDGALAVIEPYVIPIPPKDLANIHFKTESKVSILIGSTAQEIEFGQVQNFSGKTINDLKLFLKKRLDAFSPSYYSLVVDQKYKDFFKASDNYTVKYIYQTISTDVRMTCPCNLLLEEFAKSKKHTVFRYVVANRPYNPVLTEFFSFYLENSFHMWDAIALFNFKLLFKYTPNQKDNSYKKTIRENFKHFIYYGHLRRTDWDKGKTGVFNDNGGVDVLKGNYQKDKCDLWKLFDEYAWVN